MGLDNTQTKAIGTSLKREASPYKQRVAAKQLDSSELIDLPSANLSQKEKKNA